MGWLEAGFPPAPATPGMDMGPLSPASTHTSTLKSGLETHLRAEPEPRSEPQPCLLLSTQKEGEPRLVRVTVKKQRKDISWLCPRGPCSRANLPQICQPFPEMWGAQSCRG